MTREGIIWRDYTPTPAERRVDYYRKAENVRLADRFMQPKPKGHPHPEADGCAKQGDRK